MSTPEDPSAPSPPGAGPSAGDPVEPAADAPVEAVASVPGPFEPVASAQPDSLAAVAASVPGGSAERTTLAAGTAPAGAAVEGAVVEGAEPIASPPASEIEEGPRPTFVFFAIVAAISLVLDVSSKAWAEVVLGKRTIVDPALVLIENNLTLTLAYNKGGAWGLLQDASATVRKPFFLAVSVLAIGFIVSLYGRLAPGQRALKWGLPLVLGGALGNLSDRIVRNSVIDFIDYRGDWVRWMNEFIASRIWSSWSVTDHWPTFNVADISICIGVGLMAVDMLTSKRAGSGTEPAAAKPAAPPTASAVPTPAGSAPEPGAPSMDVPLTNNAFAAQPVPAEHESVPPTLASPPDSGALGPSVGDAAVPQGGAAPSVPEAAGQVAGVGTAQGPAAAPVPEAAGQLSAEVLPTEVDPTSSGSDPSS